MVEDLYVKALNDIYPGDNHSTKIFLGEANNFRHESIRKRL